MAMAASLDSRLIEARSDASASALWGGTRSRIFSILMGSAPFLERWLDERTSSSIGKRRLPIQTQDVLGPAVQQKAMLRASCPPFFSMELRETNGRTLCKMRPEIKCN